MRPVDQQTQGGGEGAVALVTQHFGSAPRDGRQVETAITVEVLEQQGSARTGTGHRGAGAGERAVAAAVQHADPVGVAREADQELGLLIAIEVAGGEQAGGRIELEMPARARSGHRPGSAAR